MTGRGRKAGSSKSDEPSKKRAKFSFDDLITEIMFLENKELKTGVLNCKKAVISIDDQKIDLLNINSDITSKVQFSQLSTEADKKNAEKLSKSMEKRLENVNDHFLNYLGQAITCKMGDNYQAIPHKLVVYQENDFCSPCDNIQEDDLTNFLIVLCPTDCKGGEINFPQFKKIISGDSNKVLNYAFFEIDKQYEILKVIKGLRVLIIYKIFKNCLNLEFKDLSVLHAEKIKGLLRNMPVNNVLISINDEKNLKKICDDIKIKYLEVYADTRNPETVYDQVEDPENHTESHDEDLATFEDLAAEGNKFNVEEHIQLSNPPRTVESFPVYFTGYDGRHNRGSDSNFEIEYFTFLLLNPDED